MNADNDEFKDTLKELEEKIEGSEKTVVTSAGSELEHGNYDSDKYAHIATATSGAQVLNSCGHRNKPSEEKAEDVKLKTETSLLKDNGKQGKDNGMQSDGHADLAIGKSNYASSKNARPANGGRPLSVGKRNRVVPTDEEITLKGKKRCKIKCAKNYRQIAAEKTKAGLRQAAKVTKVIAVDAMPEPLQGLVEDDKQEEEKKGRKGLKIEEKEAKKCRIKTSKTYKQVIQEKSKKAAKFAARKVHATAMDRLDGYIPDSVRKKMNEKLEEKGVVSPCSMQIDSPDVSRSPSPCMTKSVKTSRVKVTQRENLTTCKRNSFSNERVVVKNEVKKEVNDEMDIQYFDYVDYGENDIDYEKAQQKLDVIEDIKVYNKDKQKHGEIMTEVTVKEEDENEANHLKEDIDRRQRSKSKAVVAKRNVDQGPRRERRNYRKKEEKRVTVGGSGNEKSGVTDIINDASKCTSVSGIAKSVAPKLAQGILNNKRVKKVWDSSSNSNSNTCYCCKCCSKSSGHCDSIVKIFLSVISIAVVSYDVAMAWTAFAGYYRFEGSSPLTIVFGVVCSIASILLLLEVRNAIMSCLVNVVKVKRLQKTEEASSLRQKMIAEEYWVEIVQLLELVLGDLPIVIILALTITFASCGLYNATFKKGIVGKLALYAVFVSALWKAIMACVQFCMSKPFKRNEEGKRRMGWALFRLLRPLVALAVLFFALYIILTLNGVYINLTGRDEARAECEATEQ